MQQWSKPLRLALVGIVALSVILAATLAGLAPGRAQAATASPASETVLLAKGTQYETPLYVIHGTQSGPTIMVIGGVNGAQPAGVAAADIAASYQITAGTLLVLPEANKPAVDGNVAWVSGDVNLQTAFPTSSSGAPNGTLATAIWNAVKQYQVQYLIDLHEGPSYYASGSGSEGQTIRYQATTDGAKLGSAVLSAVNAAASPEFQALSSLPSRSLPRAAADYLGVNALLLRTTTSEDLAQRTAYATAAIDALLQTVGTGFTEVQQLAPGTQYQTPLYVIHGAKPGPAAMVVAGVNGGQPAGVAAARVAAAYGITAGTLLVVPEANKPADDANVAWVSGDVNLQTAFPTSSSGTPNGPLATAIWNVAKQHQVQYLLDLHEGPSYYASGSSSEGQTIRCTPTAAGTQLANDVLSAVNASASQKFQVLAALPTRSLPRAAADYLGVNALLLRTTTSDDLQQRTDYATAAIGALMKSAGLGLVQPVSDGTTIAEATVVTVAAGTPYATSMYVYDSGVPGPVFMVTGGTHGNEPAGYGAALKLKDEVKIKAGKLLLIPQVNILGDTRHSRYIEGTTDLNRLFPTTAGTSPTHPLALALWNIVKSYGVNYLVDLHEGYDYHLADPAADGQTFIYYPSATMQTLVTETLADLNSGITDPAKQFVPWKYPVVGSLARASGQFLGVNAGIIETTYPEPYDLRVGYDLQAVHFMLKSVGME